MTNSSATQAQIDELQSRVAFQDDALHTMSEQIAGQAEQVRLAHEHIRLLNQKLNEILAQADDPKSSSSVDERPPHY